MIATLEKFAGTIEVDIYLTADGYLQAEQFNIGGQDPEHAACIKLKELVAEFLEYAKDPDTGRISIRSIGDAYKLEEELAQAIDLLQDALYED